MTQRDLVATAIKILGLCLVVLGIIAASGECVAAYFSHRTIQQHISEAQVTDSDSDTKWSSNVSVSIQEMQRTMHLSRLGYRIIQILFGLYLCKGGVMVLNFLAGKERKKDAEPNATPLPSEGAPPDGR